MHFCRGRHLEKPFEREGHGLQAEEVLQERWHLEDRAQDGEQGIRSLAPARGPRQIISPSLCSSFPSITFLPFINNLPQELGLKRAQGARSC